MKLYAKKWIPASLVSCSLGVLTSVALTSCDSKKQDDTTPAADAPVAEKKVASAKERADKLGLLAMVPAETEAYLAIYDLPYLIGAVEQSQTVKYLKQQSGDFDFDELDIIEVDDGADAEALVAVSGKQDNPASASFASQCPVKELVIAYGPGQIDMLNALAKDYAKINETLMSPSAGGGMGMPLMMQMMAGDMSVGGLNEDSLEQLKGIIPQLELLKLIDFTPGEGMAPMIIMGTLTSDAMMQVKQGVNSAIGMAALGTNGMVAAHTAKVGELEYNGLAVKGEMIAPMLRMYKEQIPDLDPKVVEDLASRIEKGSLYILMAFKGDTAIAVICTNPEKQLALPAKAEDSILGKPQGNLADAYLDKKPAMAGYISPAFYKAAINCTVEVYKADIKTMTAMFKTLGSGEMSGKAADPVAVENTVEGFTNLYGVIIDQMEKLDTSAGYSGYSWYDKGLKAEMVTADTGDYNWSEPVIYSGVLDMPDAVLVSANSMTDAYSQRTTAVVENLIQYLWGLYGIIETSQGEGSEYYQMATQLKPGALQLWGTVKGLQPAFSQQYGFALDMNGRLPQIGDNLSKLVADGRIPRISMVQGLKDRSKLGPAWEQIKATVNENAAKLVGDAWKLDDPVSEEKDGYTSYTYACPMLPGYDMPAVTVANDIYVVGTSKAYNADVAKAAKAGKASRSAMLMKVNIEPMAKAAEHWSQIKGKERQLGQIRDFFKALNADLKGISMSVDKQDDRIYMRGHIEAR